MDELSHRNNISRMRDAVLFDGSQRGSRLSRFWTLLILASVIAAAGVVAESTATVIGAMIVAPMMLPIQGTMLATVLGDRVNLGRSVVLVVAGAAAAVSVGFVVGLLEVQDIVAATNSQVAGRVSPGLIDLLAALATGVVGSIALVRRDISDTIPGVAIAISLVPPLVVVGLTMESAAYEQSLGALLLFLTNVAAILATGIVVMALYRIHRESLSGGEPEAASINQRHAAVAIAAMLTVVAIPLAVSSFNTGHKTLQERKTHAVVEQWASEAGWDLLTVSTVLDKVLVRVTGPIPVPNTDELATRIAKEGLDPKVIKVEIVPSQQVELKEP